MPALAASVYETAMATLLLTFAVRTQKKEVSGTVLEILLRVQMASRPGSPALRTHHRGITGIIRNVYEDDKCGAESQFGCENF